MRERWKERPPTVRRPVRADEAEEIDVSHSSRVPARAHYIPLAQREPTAPPQSVFVVDQRRQQRSSRQAFPTSASSPYEHQPQQHDDVQPRLAAPRMRQTQADPYSHQGSSPRAPLQAHILDQDEQDIPTLQDEQGAPSARRRQRSRVHATLFVGLGMLAMLLMWYGGLSFLRWWQLSQDDLRYGRPRTFQIDAVVGHHDGEAHPSHFIALNYDSQVEIIEFPGGDPTKAKIYLGPPLVGQGADLIAVTLSFRDVNGDGKPDMLINVQGSIVVFLNDGQQFRPLRPGEHVQM